MSTETTRADDRASIVAFLNSEIVRLDADVVAAEEEFDETDGYDLIEQIACLRAQSGIARVWASQVARSDDRVTVAPNDATETTRVFTRQELEDLMLPYEHNEVLTDQEVSEHRWYIKRAVTFRLAGQSEGEAWQACYSRPKTDDSGVETWTAEVTATLVRKVTKTVEVWE